MIGRREFVRLGLLAGLSGLSSCTPIGINPTLRAYKGTLPKELLQILPAPWRYKSLDYPPDVDPYSVALEQGGDLYALGDGWLASFPKEALQSIGSDELTSRLNSQARSFLGSLEPDLSKKVLPVGVSPWVMLFRKGDSWLDQARKGWKVLLDHELKRNVIFPESPRVVMSLAERIAVPNALLRLRGQARAFDDRNGLKWVLSGEARVCVMPLQRCWQALTKDPRLSVVLPESGAPLNWTLLVRPAFTREPLPKYWLEKAWSSPYIERLLSIGWVSPLLLKDLRKKIEFIPERYQSILIPSDSIWTKCWSLPPLTAIEKNSQEILWNASTP